VDAFRVLTVDGPRTIAPADGYVLPHEHLLCDLRVWWEGEAFDDVADEPALVVAAFDALRRWPAAVTPENLVLSDWYVAAKELRRAARTGCRVVVDLTNTGMSPTPALAAKAARLAGVDLVASVGRYLHDTLDAAERARSRTELVDEWMHAIQHGIDGCAVGMIGEIGTSAAITDAERVSLEAAAEVQRRSGLPVNVHLHVHARQGQRVLDVLADAGADLARVALSHCDGELDLDWLRGLLARGCYVELDLFGREDWPAAGGGFPSDRERIDAVAALCADGHADRLLLSHDICLRSALHRYGGWGYDHLAERILPAIAERAGEDAARRITRTNPLTLLHVEEAASDDWPMP
jgi:phosphotriesterase-related protein